MVMIKLFLLNLGKYAMFIFIIKLDKLLSYFCNKCVRFVTFWASNVRL